MNNPSPVKLSYTLSKNDYLDHLLYTASKTPSVVKKRRNNRIILPILYLSIALFGIAIGNLAMFSSLFLLSLLWYILFPKWENKQYIRQYSKYLDEQLEDNTDEDVELEFSNASIIKKGADYEYTIFYRQIRGWYETGQAIYIGLMDDYTIIIPKRSVQQLDEIEEIVSNNQEGVLIKVTKDLNWKWE